VVRDLAARPAPDRFEASEEIGILLQIGDVEENVFLISKRAIRNWLRHNGAQESAERLLLG
jgi:hypothetical protein